MKYLQLYTWKATQLQEVGGNLPPKYKSDLSLQTKPMSGLSVAPQKISVNTKPFSTSNKRQRTSNAFHAIAVFTCSRNCKRKFVGSTMQTTNLYPVVQGHASVLLLILDHVVSRSLSRGVERLSYSIVEVSWLLGVACQCTLICIYKILYNIYIYMYKFDIYIYNTYYMYTVYISELYCMIFF